MFFQTLVDLHFTFCLRRHLRQLSVLAHLPTQCPVVVLIHLVFHQSLCLSRPVCARGGIHLWLMPPAGPPHAVFAETNTAACSQALSNRVDTRIPGFWLCLCLVYDWLGPASLSGMSAHKSLLLPAMLDLETLYACPKFWCDCLLLLSQTKKRSKGLF